MSDEPKEKNPEWLARVKATHKLHVERLKVNPRHTIGETAKELKRAIGPVSEELKVASWLRTHSTQLREFEYIHEAVEYIRERKHKMLTEDIE